MLAPCPYCSSTSFEEEDGLLVCSNCGRRVEGAQQITTAEEEFGTLGKITRLARDKESRPKPTKTVRGQKAYRLYLLAWQQVLYRQSRALRDLEAPAELWTVTRNLYGLMLAGYVQRFNDTPSTLDQSSAPSLRVISASTPSEVVTNSTTDLSSSHRDSDTDHPSNLTDSANRQSLQPKLQDTISLLYLSALIIRYPLSLSKFYDYLTNEQVPFIRPLRYIADIISRLPPEYQESFDTTTLPTPLHLQRSVYTFLRTFTSVHGISLPAQNFRPILWSFITQLHLPIECYSHAIQLVDRLNYDFTYTFIKRRNSTSIPEIALMSCLIIAAKFVIPFHGSGKRISFDWEQWKNIELERQKKEKLPISVKAEDINEMTGEEMDKYLDWYQGMFVSKIEEKATESQKKIFEMFPLQETETRDDEAGFGVGDVQRRLVRMGGERAGYIVIKDESMDENVLVFHRRAAEVACASLKQLVRAVRHTERKLEAGQSKGEDE